jgi:hypothetical protein
MDLAVHVEDGSAGGFFIMDELVGRLTDLINLPSGRVIVASTVAQVFRRNDLIRWVRFYQCAQKGPNVLELRVVWDREPDGEVRRRLAEGMRDIADADTVVRLRDVEDIVRLPSGKAWVVRDERAS